MDFKNPLAQPGLCTANRRSIRDAQPWGGLERNLYEDSYIDLPCCGAYTANVNPDAERWRQLAAYDLATADAMLASGRYLYVLFCSQQAVEKLIKAIIVERTGAFPPRTHDLNKEPRSKLRGITG